MAFCPDCGKQTENDTKFCPNCGKNLTNNILNGPKEGKIELPPVPVAAPANKKTTQKKGCLGCLGLVILLFIIVAAIGGNASDSTSKTTSSKSAASQQPKSEADLYSYTCTVDGIGKVRGGVSSDVGVAIAEIQEVASIDGAFSTTQAQGLFKVIYIVASNHQKDAVTLDANSFKLIDDKGREFSHSVHADTALQMKGRKTLFLEQINPGITMGGYVAFDVPKDAHIIKMEFRGGMSGKKGDVPFKVMMVN